MHGRIPWAAAAPLDGRGRELRCQLARQGMVVVRADER